MTDDELRDLAAKALTFPSLDAEEHFGVLTDALLERGLIPEYVAPRKVRRKRERGAAERHYRFHTFSWARQTWPLSYPHWRIERRHGFSPPSLVEQIEQLRGLYDSGIIDRHEFLRLFDSYYAPTIIESNAPIQIVTNPAMPEDAFILSTRNDHLRVVNLGLNYDWSSEKESDSHE